MPPLDLSKYGAKALEIKPEHTLDLSKYGATPVASTNEPVKGETKPGIGRKVIDFFTGSTQKFGETAGNALALPEAKKQYEKSTQSFQQVQDNLIKTIQEKKKLGQDTSKLEETLKEHMKVSPKFEDFTRGDILNKTTGQVLGEAGGTVLEALQGGLLSSGKKIVASKSLSTLQKVGQGARIGGAYGAVSGGTNAMQEGGGVADTLEGAVTGGLTGAALGGGLGLAGADLSKIANRTRTDRIANIVTKREEELAKIDSNYSNMRKASGFSKDGGEASRKRVASTDVLVDSVDENGLIRTKEPGGAIDQYKSQTIDNAEGVVRNNLERLGETVKLDTVEKELTQAVKESGLEGADLKTALNNIKKEMAGYRLKADKNGKVPLVLMHDAKISTTKGINYQTPPEVKSYRKAIARGLKKVVENNSSFNTQEVNAELSKYLDDVAFLERLDGKRVKGGKLGKYFAQIGGNVAGGLVGGAIGGVPGSAVGTIVGGEVAGKLKGSALSKTFGTKTGLVAPKSAILEDAIERGNSPRLQLPAPKPGQPRIQIPSGKTINLPAKSQTSLDEAHRLRNFQVQNTISPTKKPYNISKTIAQKAEKGNIPKELESLTQEARKYKSAEEFVKAQPVGFHATGANTKITKWSTKNAFGRIWFTDNKEAITRNNVGASGKGKVYEVYFDKKAKWATPEQANKSYTDQLISEGYDGVYHPDSSGEYGNYYEVFNPKVIKTKSQLTDFYNKVIGKGLKRPKSGGLTTPDTMLGVAGGTLGAFGLDKIAQKFGTQTYKATPKEELKKVNTVIEPKKLGNALMQLESSGGKNKKNAGKTEQLWLVGLTKTALDELKRTGVKPNVDINSKEDVIDAGIKYFTLMQDRHPELTPAEVYVKYYWTQAKTQKQRQDKINEFNRLIQNG